MLLACDVFCLKSLSERFETDNLPCSFVIVPVTSPEVPALNTEIVELIRGSLSSSDITLPDSLIKFQPKPREPFREFYMHNGLWKKEKNKMMNFLKALIHIGISAIFISITGCSKTEPENVLTVTTEDIELFSEGIYTLNGTIVSTGNEEIITYGFYWSETKNPEKDGDTIRLGSRNSTGSFSSIVYSILPGRTYFVRAFAVSASIICLGEVKSFTTPENMKHPVFDVDKNIYYPVKIGDQTWLAQNLQVTRYTDGSSIPRVEDRLKWYDFALYTRAYCWYENFAVIGAQYGGLYTWPAAMNISSSRDIKPGDIQGICPDGWHLPSDNEWKQLELFLGLDQTMVDKEKWRGDDEGGMLKLEGTKVWTDPNTGSTNKSGFSALPAGWRNGAGYFKDLGSTARFWSSSIRGDYAWIRRLDNNSSQIYRSTDGLYHAYSVRCIKDNLDDNKDDIPIKSGFWH